MKDINMKRFYLSKTMWFNALSILLGVALFFGYTPDENLMAETTKYLLIITPFINLLLRLMTKKGITL